MNKGLIDRYILLLFPVLFVQSGSAQQSKSPNTCVLSKNVYSYFDKINNDSVKYSLSGSTDKCNFSLVDSLVNNFILHADSKSYKMLKNIAKYSDGYLSDYLVEEIRKIYTNRFADFFDYLYWDYKNGTKNKLENYLVENWSGMAAESNNSSSVMAKIKMKTTKDISSCKEDCQDKNIYLNSILKKINPKYLD